MLPIITILASTPWSYFACRYGSRVCCSSMKETVRSDGGGREGPRAEEEETEETRPSYVAARWEETPPRPRNTTTRATWA